MLMYQWANWTTLFGTQPKSCRACEETGDSRNPDYNGAYLPGAGRGPGRGRVRLLGLGLAVGLFSLKEKVCTSKGFLWTAWKYVYIYILYIYYGHIYINVERSNVFLVVVLTDEWLLMYNIFFCLKHVIFIHLSHERIVLFCLDPYIFSSNIPWWIQDPIAGFNRKTSTLESQFLSSPAVAGPTQFNTDGGLPNRKRDKWWEGTRIFRSQHLGFM